MERSMVVALVIVALAHPATAQPSEPAERRWHFELGAGVGLPLGDFDEENPSPSVRAEIGARLASNVGFFVGYRRTSISSDAQDVLHDRTFSLGLRYAAPISCVLLLFGRASLDVVSFEIDSTNMAFNGPVHKTSAGFGAGAGIIATIGSAEKIGVGLALDYARASHNFSELASLGPRFEGTFADSWLTLGVFAYLGL